MKTEKKITLIAIILLILVIIAAAFVGVYKLKDYSIKNIVPKYLLSMEFNNTRNILMEVDRSVENTKIYDAQGNEIEPEEGVEYKEEDGYKKVEEKANSDDKLTKENYRLVKNCLFERLKASKANQYVIKQNNENGTIQIQIPDDDNADDLIKMLSQNGNFQVVDENTGEILLDKSHLANTSVVYYSQNDNSTLVALKIDLNQEGKKIFKEMSKKYIATTEQVTDEETGEKTDKTTELKVDVKIDGTSYLKHYFQDVEPGILKFLNAEEGSITIAIGLTSDTDELQGYIDTATELETILNTNEIPLKYTVAQEIISEEISINTLNIIIYVGIGLLLVLCIFNIIKFKSRGIIIDLLQLGYIGLLLLIIRYTNVYISIEGILGIAIVTIINYMLNYSILKNEGQLNKVILNYLVKLIPIYFIAIVFAFAGIVNISSLGMILFWGLSIMFIYNILITKITLNTIEK